MARIFITGSADGLGLIAAKKLIGQGHSVVMHARNEARAVQLRQLSVGQEAILTADLSSAADTMRLANDVNNLGLFDSIIHNAGVYQVPENEHTADNLPTLFAVNTIATFILTALINPPARLVYLSSGMHRQGDASLKGLQDLKNIRVTYSDTKLHDLLISKTVARRWKNVYSNAVDPGWVPTKMGGAGAPDDLQKGAETQAWLASGEAGSNVSGGYYHHLKTDRTHHDADDAGIQDKLITICEEVTGIVFPSAK